MKTDTPTVVCVIASEAPEVLHAVEEMARVKSAPDNVSVAVGRAFPGGVEERVERRYRVSDYFESVEITENAADASFTIVFHVRRGVDGYWKDLIAHILMDVEQAGASVKSVTRIA